MFEPVYVELQPLALISQLFIEHVASVDIHPVDKLTKSAFYVPEL